MSAEEHALQSSVVVYLRGDSVVYLYRDVQYNLGDIRYTGRLLIHAHTHNLCMDNSVVSP